MKKLLLLATFLSVSLNSYGQVFSVDYLVEINDITGDYDCKIIIQEGSAATFGERVLFNTSYTIVVPTGTNISVVETFNPLLNNQFLNGTVPTDWLISNTAISPTEQPENDFYSIIPETNPTVSFNTLNIGDVVTLFSVSADLDCNLDIRPFENGVDENIINSLDFSNGITIGGTDQLYTGNELPSSFDADFEISGNEYEICLGDCVTISPNVLCAPLGLTYLWSTGETTETITVCPTSFEIYEASINGPQGLSESTSINVYVEFDVIGFDDEEFFCVGNSYFPYSEFDYETWASSDESIASFDNNELLIHAEGVTTISTTSPAGCVTELEITTSPLPTIDFDGPNEICVNANTFLTSTSSVIWTTDNSGVAVIDNNGLVTGISPGSTFPTALNTETGCSDTYDIPIIVLPAPYIQNNGSDDLCIGETTQMASAVDGTWETSNPSVASIDNSGLVTALSSGEVFVAFSDAVDGCIGIYERITVIPLPEIISGDTNICVGDVTQLLPTTGGTWVSNNPSVATITNSGVATGISEGVVRFYYTSATTGCTSEASNPTFVGSCNVNPSPTCDQTEVICDMDLLNGYIGQMFDEESSGEQPIPLCPGSQSIPNNISWIGFVAPEGEYILTINPFNCPLTGTGSDGVQIGIYTTCTFEEAIYCSGDCSLEPLSLSDNSFTPGETYYLFIDGCLGTVCEYEIIIEGNYISQCESPCDDATINTEWEYVLAGEFASDLVINTYTTGTNLLSTDDLDHLVYYEQVDGNIVLKENNGNGYLDNEMILYDNDNHYGLGNYNLYLEDVDNDGLTDIILAESGIVTMTGEIGDEISVLQNMGNGNFALQIKEQVCGMEGPNNLKIADYDNDGMKDIFFECVDLLIGVLWINNWDDSELTNFNSQSYCHVYTGDFNTDGFQDIAISTAFALINQGDRTFSSQNLQVFETDCSGLTYFVEETNTILDPYFASTITDPFLLNTEFCSDHYYGDNENEIFRAYITSPDVESIIIPQIEGFHFLDPNQECSFSLEGIQIPNVVARQNTKIDLTLNGCTDFLVIEGDQIFAWINPKQSNKILGTAYIDANGNGIFDSNESPLRNVLITIVPGELSILTDDDGNYVLSVPDGEYDITAKVNEGEWEQDMLSINNIQIDEPCNEGYNFGFIPIITPEETANISMVNTIARCDFETRFTITVENTGSEPLDGVLRFEFDDKTTFFSSDIPSYILSGNSLMADVGPLAPFVPQKYEIKVKMPSGSSNLPMLAFKSTLLDKFGEEIAEIGYSDQLRCSYDPNDKRVHPDRMGDENLTLMDEDLEYTIRFQNNGNDTAFQVKIVDPLDSAIDPTTIRVVSASHAVETCIEGTDLIFLFEDILLVDSTTNYAESQGYVTFRCNVKEGLAEMTPVQNQADIIFDTNSPIVTNQTINTLVSFLCTDKQTLIEASICDGEAYEGYNASGTYTNTFDLPFGCDSVVTIVLDVQGITYTQQNLQTCAGSSITVAGTVYDIEENTTIKDTTVNENGCITNILTFEVEAVSDIFENVPDLEVCSGENFSAFTNLDGTWISDDESIVIVNESGNFSSIGNGSTTLIFTDNQLGCTNELPVTVFANPIIENTGSAQICINDSTTITSDMDGIWISDNPDVALANSDNIVVGLSEGTANFIFTNVETGCNAVLAIEVLPVSDPMCLVGTDDLYENTVSIYPNPATESIFIESELNWKSIRIVDTQGKTVSSISQSKTGKSEVDITSFLSGVYIIIFQDEEKLVTKRFVKK